MTVTPPEYDGCLWPVDPACLSEQWEALDAPTQNRALALASSTLQRLTGYRVGGCPVTVRPCAQRCTGSARAMVPSFGSPTGFISPGIDLFGQWVNGCGCSTDCSCVALCEIALPAPVGRIDEVRVDGAVVPTTDYRVDNGNLLVWTGEGACPWPVCQDMAAPITEPGTFSVTYLNAYPVDALGAYAAGVLAMEFAKACTGSKCRLPAGVTSISRQGVQMEIASGAFPGGMTGIREVDSFISLWNPNSLSRQSAVWTPTTRTPRITTLGGTP